MDKLRQEFKDRPKGSFTSNVCACYCCQKGLFIQVCILENPVLITFKAYNVKGSHAGEGESCFVI